MTRLAGVVRGILWLGPPAFRRGYEAEILDTLASALEAERRRRGLLAMTILWIRSVGDAIRTVRRERGLAAQTGGARGPMADLGGDVRYVFRSWRRTPGLSATIVLTLALGLGLAAAIFSFADGYLFRPLPFPSADRLYFVADPNAEIGAALKATDTALLRRSDVAAFGFVEWDTGDRVRGELRVGDRRVELYAHGVSRNFRATIALPLVAGRDFTDDDHREGALLVAWLTHRFWQQAFAGDRGVVGQSFKVEAGRSSIDLHVVGILGPEVASFDLNNRPPDIIVPSIAPAVVRPMLLSFPLVRLPDGVSREQGEVRIAAALQATAPASDGRPRVVKLRSLRESQVAGGRPTARVLFAGSLLVLLLAAINLVHLLLTRGVARAAEVATRAALGATRWRIARLFLVESLLLGVIGIAGGLALGAALSAVIASQVPRFPTGARNLALVPVLFDGRVIAFAASLGIVVTIVGGWWPAWRTLRRPLAWTSRSASGIVANVPARVSRSILASELAVATIVMVGTLFIGLGIWRYLHQPLGFEYVDRFRIGIASAEPRRTTAAEMDAALHAIRDLPGITSAGPYETSTLQGVEVPGRALAPTAVGASGASPGYLEAWSLRMRAGRWFTAEEFSGDAPVAVVDEALARLVWPDVDPLTQEIRVGGGALRRVIGVIEPRRLRLDRPTTPQVFVPTAQPRPGGSLVAWAPRAPVVDIQTRLAAAVRDALPGADVRVTPISLESLFLRDIGEATFQAPIVVAFGILAFALAGIGVFGLVSYLVEQRTREFGIRIALGARPADIWRGVVAQSVVPAIVGLGVGVAGARALESVVRAAAFGWESSSAIAVSGVIVALLGVAVLAAAGPARRAMHVDPAVALRID